MTMMHELPFGYALVLYLASMVIGIIFGLAAWRLFGELLVFIAWMGETKKTPSFGWWHDK